MPRIARASVGGVWHQTLNRGKGRLPVFRKEGDYTVFLKVMHALADEIPLARAGLLPDAQSHPSRPLALRRWRAESLDALAAQHPRAPLPPARSHELPSWQASFKAFPIEQDEHLLTVLRHVERNSLRAGLVERAEQWLRSSLRERSPGVVNTLVHPGSVPRPANCVALVNQAQTETEVEALRECGRRCRPLGNEELVNDTAT